MATCRQKRGAVMGRGCLSPRRKRVFCFYARKNDRDQDGPSMNRWELHGTGAGESLDHSLRPLPHDGRRDPGRTVCRVR